MLRSKYDIPDLANDFIVGTSDFSPDDLICSQAGGKFINVDEGSRIFLATLPLSRAVLDLRVPRIDLLGGFLFIIPAKRTHVWPSYEFANVCKEAFAIILASIRPKGESGISKASQVPHRLTISCAVQLWVMQDCLFQLRISDLALRHRGCEANRAKKRSGN